MRVVPALLGAALLALVGAAFAAAEDDAKALLERMVSEGGQVSFRGTMVHMCGGKVDVVNVVHRYADGGVTERVKTLDADGREMIHSPEKIHVHHAGRKDGDGGFADNRRTTYRAPACAAAQFCQCGSIQLSTGHAR